MDLSTLVLRKATQEDAAIIAEQRRLMFEEMGFADRERLQEMQVEFQDWVSEKLELGEYHGWFLADPFGSVVGGAGVWLMEWPPTPVDLSEQRAYILNVYTKPDLRRKGVARRLMNTILDYTRAHGIATLALHASRDGHDLYVQMGFQQTNEMRFHFADID